MFLILEFIINKETKKTFTNSCLDLTDECDASIGLSCLVSLEGYKKCL